MTPLLLYLDRILIASLISVGMVTLYVIPYEVITRLRVVPASLVNALFPSLSEHSGNVARESLINLYHTSLKYMLVVLLPCFLLLGFLGPDIISAWVGPGYALWGGRVMRIIAGGAFLNSLAYVPYAALVALGRPDLPAKFHLAELPAYILLSIVLIPKWGIVGAALAVTIRLSADAIALFWSARRYVGCAPALRGLWRPIVLNGLITFFLCLITLWPISISLRLVAGSLCAVAYVPGVWFFVLHDFERPQIIRMLYARGGTA
jgi:O-antigen/teichoic acid export membrane protein